MLVRLYGFPMLRLVLDLLAMLVGKVPVVSWMGRWFLDVTWVTKELSAANMALGSGPRPPGPAGRSA